MGSLKRKLERKQQKKDKKLEKEMSKKMMMFDKLEDHCAACEKPFDKKSKEHVSTWNVVVREKEDVVRLYCPECWGKANKLIEEIQNDLRDRSERGGESSEQSESE
jgi:hypothetical protein|tara:strand:- start:1018 stop:1335 length:318 start_codon:yes stop_codon:yes gene_type:complete